MQSITFFHPKGEDDYWGYKLTWAVNVLLEWKFSEPWLFTYIMWIQDFNNRVIEIIRFTHEWLIIPSK